MFETTTSRDMIVEATTSSMVPGAHIEVAFQKLGRDVSKYVDGSGALPFDIGNERGYYHIDMMPVLPESLPEVLEKLYRIQERGTERASDIASALIENLTTRNDITNEELTWLYKIAEDGGRFKLTQVLEATPGLTNALSKFKYKGDCKCGFRVPKYPGRYPKNCPECGDTLYLKDESKMDEGRLLVGDYFQQEQRDYTIYGRVVSVQKNGSHRAVVFSSENPKAVVTSLSGWYPAPVGISPKDVPPKVKSKIDSKADSMLSESEDLEEAVSYTLETEYEGVLWHVLDGKKVIGNVIKTALRGFEPTFIPDSGTKNAKSFPFTRDLKSAANAVWAAYQAQNESTRMNEAAFVLKKHSSDPEWGDLDVPGFDVFVGGKRIGIVQQIKGKWSAASHSWSGPPRKTKEEAAKDLLSKPWVRRRESAEVHSALRILDKRIRLMRGASLNERTVALTHPLPEGATSIQKAILGEDSDCDKKEVFSALVEYLNSSQDPSYDKIVGVMMERFSPEEGMTERLRQEVRKRTPLVKAIRSLVEMEDEDRRYFTLNKALSSCFTRVMIEGETMGGENFKFLGKHIFEMMQRALDRDLDGPSRFLNTYFLEG